MAEEATHAPKSASWYHQAAKVGMSMNSDSRKVSVPIVLNTIRQLNKRVI